MHHLTFPLSRLLVPGNNTSAPLFSLEFSCKMLTSIPQALMLIYMEEMLATSNCHFAESAYNVSLK